MFANFNADNLKKKKKKKKKKGRVRLMSADECQLMTHLQLVSKFIQSSTRKREKSINSWSC